MYFFIQIVMEGTQFLDWAELIAHSLRNQLKWALNLKKEFHMSSYLMYMLVSTQDLHSLSNEPRMGNVPVYQCYPVLHRERAFENFRRVHDIFSGKLYF
jgi:hypothetical protein